MENLLQQETDPRVVAFEDECIRQTSRGARKGHLKVEDERRKKRMEMRKAALDRWEGNALMAGILAPAPTDGDGDGGDGAEMAA